jgi:hypothetical protein
MGSGDTQRCPPGPVNACHGHGWPGAGGFLPQVITPLSGPEFAASMGAPGVLRIYKFVLRFGLSIH